VKDVLNLELNIDKVHTEYEYPQPVGFVRSKYDLFAEDVEQRVIVEIQHLKQDDFFDRFLYYHLVSLVEQIGNYQEYDFEKTVYTIVVLTTLPRDGSISFSCAISDMNPIDEHGKKHEIYSHRLIFLCPRLVNQHTPAKIKKWLELIEDSLDGQVEETLYSGTTFAAIFKLIQRHHLDRELLAQIKDEAAWENVKRRQREEGFEEGIQHGLEQGEKRKAIEAAQKMLADRMPREIVLKYTGLTEAELEEKKND
jgi:predicted transposase/invertase (TIGR01784 family)